MEVDSGWMSGSERSEAVLLEEGREGVDSFEVCCHSPLLFWVGVEDAPWFHCPLVFWDIVK
jgi:hypothetical protein